MASSATHAALTPAAILRPDALRAALIAGALAFATIAGAWIFEALGYLPCELCLMQRWAYYAGVPVAVVAAFLAAQGGRAPARALLWLLALIFIGSAIFGVYHAGVEWKFWPGPTGCTGAIQKAGSVDDFMKQLQITKVVRCDEVAIRIFGLSLAGWNAIISSVIVWIAAQGARRG